jgi:YgiT-type zinc finger domain-containing protein
MRCQDCGQGETRTGVTTVPLQVGSTVILVQGVPSDICDACGKFFVDSTTSNHLLRLSQTALARGERTIDYQVEAEE